MFHGWKKNQKKKEYLMAYENYGIQVSVSVIKVW